MSDYRIKVNLYKNGKQVDCDAEYEFESDKHETFIEQVIRAYTSAIIGEKFNITKATEWLLENEDEIFKIANDISDDVMKQELHDYHNIDLESIDWESLSEALGISVEKTQEFILSDKYTRERFANLLSKGNKTNK